MTMPSTPEVQAGMLDRISAWDGIGVVVRYDRPSGTWIFIAMHDDTLGRPAGGCRMKTYDCPEDGLSDALRLSEGMTYKWAAIEMGFGGGKSVLAIPRPMEGAERTGLLERFAALLNTLQDSYGVGPDMGTTPDDMQVIARVSDNVVGVTPGGGGRHTDPGPFTALGVFAGIRAALRYRYDSDDLTHRSVHVQGVGDVGYPLARMVHDAGGRVLVSDLDGERGASVAAEVGGEVIEADHAYDVECDVYAPCAVGSTLNARTIAQLACGVVAGSANNQLETDDDAQRLLDRDILYAPDYIINAGGAMTFGLISQGITDTAELEERVGGIGQTLDVIFREAESEGVTPPESARRKVERILASARAARAGLLVAFALAMGMAPASAAAQARARIAGRVFDTFGEPVPQAFVTVRNPESGVAYTVYSDVQGRYVIPGIPAGTYQVEAKHWVFGEEHRLGVPFEGGSETWNFTLAGQMYRYGPSSTFLNQIPEGEDKRRFINDCTGCHVLNEQIMLRDNRFRTAEEWQDAVSLMIGRFGQGSGFPIISGHPDPTRDPIWILRALRNYPEQFAAPDYNERTLSRALLTEYDFPVPQDLPHDLMVDRDGRVVITGMLTDVMYVLDPESGAYERVPIPVANANPRALDIGRDGR